MGKPISEHECDARANQMAQMKMSNFRVHRDGIKSTWRKMGCGIPVSVLRVPIMGGTRTNVVDGDVVTLGYCE